MSQLNEEHFKKQVEKADLALKKQNFDYAIALYQAALQLNPRAHEIRRKLHRVAALAVQEKGGKPEGGLSVKLKVLQPEAKAKKCHLQKRYEEELIELEKVLQVQPHNVGTLMALANALECLEYWESAASTYEEVIELDRNNPNLDACRRLGNILGDKMDDPEKAIDYWEKVKTFKPDDKEAGKAIRDLSAATMVKNAEKRKAAGGDESFRSLLKSEDEAKQLQVMQQNIRTDDDRKKVIKFLLEEIKKDPKNTRHYRDVGGHLVELRQWEKAEQFFRKALEINPTDTHAMQKLSHLKETRLEHELENLKKRLNGGEGGEALRGEIVQKEAEFRKFRLEEYDRRIKAHPTDYGIKFQFGRLLFDDGQYKEAIAQFQKSVKDPKMKVKSKEGIGDCFMAEGLSDMAKTQYGEALSEVSERGSELWKELKYKLAVAAEKNGNRDEALQHYQEIMADDIAYLDVASRVKNLRG